MSLLQGVVNTCDVAVSVDGPGDDEVVGRFSALLWPTARPPPPEAAMATTAAPTLATVAVATTGPQAVATRTAVSLSLLRLCSNGDDCLADGEYCGN